MTWHRMCTLMATRNCYEGGMSAKKIAEQSNVSLSTVYYRLKTLGTEIRGGGK